MKRQGADKKSLCMPPAAQAQGKAAPVGNVVFFLLSLMLHTAALAALWFLAVSTPGTGQGAGAGQYVTVSLLSGLPGASGDGDASASRDADNVSTSASTPASTSAADTDVAPAPVTWDSDTAHVPDSQDKQPEAPPAEPSVPAVAAIPVHKIKTGQKDRPKTESQKTQKREADSRKPDSRTPESLKPDSRKPDSRKPESADAENVAHKHARQASQEQGRQGGKALGVGHEQGGNATGHGGQAGEKGNAGAGTSAAHQGSSAGYLKGNYEYIKKRVRQYLVYSPQAKRMGIQGLVTVSFTIQQDGRVRDVAVSKSSGYALLDESALEAVRSAAPFAAPPEPARVIMPVQFSLR